MNIDSIRVLSGPNLWSDEPALEAVLSFGEPALNEQLLIGVRRLLPDSLQGALGPVSSATEPEYWAAFLARLAVAFQAAVGSKVAFSASRALTSPTEFRLLVEYEEEATARRALALALELVHVASTGGDVDLAAQLVDLRKLHQEARLGPSTGCIVRAAQARKIPVRRLTGSLVQLGHGARQRRIWAAETDRTSSVAESIAQDKELTKSLLDAVGIPVPVGVPVPSAEAAWLAAQQIGLPVVVKPRSGNQGRGVSVRLSTREAVMAAFDIARSDGEVMVERHIEGADYRLLVIDGQLVAAARRDPPRVIADGRHTIAELVASENLDPRRGDDHSTSLSKLRLDEIARELLAEQGFSFDSVPSAGVPVVLRRNANLSTGGTAADVTDDVHPSIARCAVDAARMVGLDVAGVDFVATRIDAPLELTRGAVVEVNAAPGLRMHVEPSSGRSRPVGQAIIDSMFRAGDDARIPVVAVTGTNGKTTTTRCIAHLLEQRGLRVGMTCTDGIYVEGRRIDTGDCSGPRSARLVLAHPRVDAAVLETARGGMLREGLGFDWCDVAVVTNVGEGDHLGMGGIHTAAELARVKAIPVRRVSERGAAVLNADDPLVAAMASDCRGAVIFFSRNADSARLASHRAAGGKAVTVRDGFVVICSGHDERRVAQVDQLPLTHGGRIGFQVDNLLAAVAAGFWLGLSVDALRFGIQTFSSDVGTVPGRFNVLVHREATIILDYGHNASALLALNEAIAKMPHRRRKIVYTAAGDRRDEDIQRQAEIIAGFFDEVFIYEDQCTRGRADGEVIRLMRDGMLRCKKGPRRIWQKSGELRAIAAAISGLEPGDLLLCQVDQVESALSFVKGLFQKAEARPVVPLAQYAAAALAALNLLGGGG